MGADASLVRKAMAKGSLLSTPPVNAIKLDNTVLKLMDVAEVSEESKTGT
jgi:hypothetical protein